MLVGAIERGVEREFVSMCWEILASDSDLHDAAMEATDLSPTERKR
jgi:hypothetical protein